MENRSCDITKIWQSLDLLFRSAQKLISIGKMSRQCLGAPQKRMLVVFNFNNDIAEYWEYSDQGYVSIELTNEAFKLGVNYVVYAHTH